MSLNSINKNVRSELVHKILDKGKKHSKKAAQYFNELVATYSDPQLVDLAECLKENEGEEDDKKQECCSKLKNYRLRQACEHQVSVGPEPFNRLMYGVPTAITVGSSAAGIIPSLLNPLITWAVLPAFLMHRAILDYDRTRLNDLLKLRTRERIRGHPRPSTSYRPPLYYPNVYLRQSEADDSYSYPPVPPPPPPPPPHQPPLSYSSPVPSMASSLSTSSTSSLSPPPAAIPRMNVHTNKSHLSPQERRTSVVLKRKLKTVHSKHKKKL